LLAAVVLVSGIALLGLWVVLGVLREVVAEVRQRRTKWHRRRTTDRVDSPR